MPQAWDARGFLASFQNGDSTGELVEAISQLSLEQLRDLERFLAVQDSSIVSGDRRE